jgi:hypothetical protein
MAYTSFEELIKEEVFGILPRPSNTGFHRIRCQVCNDHSPRGGFKFDNGVIGYNCFNCGAVAKHTDGSETASNDFKEVLQAFGIPTHTIKEILNQAFFKRVKGQVSDTPSIITLADLNKPKEFDFSTPTIQLPDSSFPLGYPKGKEEQQKFLEYVSSRGLTKYQSKFMFSLDPERKDELIIPFYRNGKLIYWQARNINPDTPKSERYDNCTQPKDKIIYGYDELFSYSPYPLFVTEGVFDCIPLNGCAIIGSKIPEIKLEILKKTKRDLVFVVDRDRNGKLFGFTALENGWCVSFPPENSIDVNMSIKKNGLYWTIQYLMKNIERNPLKAEVRIKFISDKFYE